MGLDLAATLMGERGLQALDSKETRKRLSYYRATRAASSYLRLQGAPALASEPDDAGVAALRWYVGDNNAEQILSETRRSTGRQVILRNASDELSIANSWRSFILDPTYFRNAEVGTGTTLLWSSYLGKDGRAEVRHQSATRHASMMADLAERGPAAIFATGPSLADVPLGRASDRFPIRIACNSVVANRELLDEIRPNVFTFGDPAFHFGPSPYAQRFREDLAYLLEKHDPWIVVPEFNYPLLAREYAGQFGLEKVIGARLTLRSPTAKAREAVYARRASNILTLFMMPLAARLSSEVTFFGCDGRAASDTGFWKHNPATQYDDLYQTVVDAHPSFFRDTDYVAYYQRHCDVMERQVAHLKERGIQLSSGTPSHIPALRSLAQSAL